MIYVDPSVVLAQLLSEDRTPPARLWENALVSSRLIEYEVWNRIHARGLTLSHGDLVRQLIGRIALLELSPPVLARALEPFPSPVRTLDALHLSSVHYLLEQGLRVSLACYSEWMLSAARKLHFAIYRL